MAVETDFSWRRLSFLQKNKQFKSSGKEPRLFILRLKMMAFHKNLETLNLHIQVGFTIQVSKCKSICLSQIFKKWQEGSWFCFSAGSNGFLKSLTPLYRMTFFFFCPCGSGEAPSSWLTANVKYRALLLNFYTFLVLQSLSSLHSQDTDCSYYLYGYWGGLALFTLIGSIANWKVFF